MNNFIKIFNHNLLLKWIFIPALLLSTWFILSTTYLITSDLSSSVLSYNHEEETQIPQEYVENNGTKEWHGRFKAKDNYLGIVTIEFTRTQKPIFDQVSFMIKEKDAIDWYEINTYDARQFYFLSKFPFGFKVIENSKDKIYEFKFVSLSGSQLYKASLEKPNPIVISKYQYPKKLLINDPFLLISFLYKKIIYSLSIQEYQNIIILFALPLFFYMNLISLMEIGLIKEATISKLIKTPAYLFFKNQFKFVDNIFVLSWVVAVFVNIFSLNQTYDVLSILLLGIWLILILKFKINHQASFSMALMLVIFFPILFYFNSDSVLKKNSDWIFYFLLFGLFHALIELRFKNEDK